MKYKILAFCLSTLCFLLTYNNTFAIVPGSNYNPAFPQEYEIGEPTIIVYIVDGILIALLAFFVLRYIIRKIQKSKKEK